MEIIKIANPEIFDRKLKERSRQMYDLLTYIARNMDKPKSIEIKLERLFNELADECSKERDKNRNDCGEAYSKKDWDSIYKDRQKGMSIIDLAKKHKIHAQSIRWRFNNKFDPLKQ